MAKYRKKPVIIEAALYDGKLVGEPDGKGGVIPRTCPEWFPAVVVETHPDNIWAGVGQVFYAGDKLRIGTLEGGVTASPGDWIICGIKGEMYPCKPDVFAATYELFSPERLETDMVERVAWALVKANGIINPNELTDWQMAGYHRSARAAIAAMREPSEAMVDAGLNSGMWGPGVAIRADEIDANPTDVWRAMIDAALSSPAK